MRQTVLRKWAAFRIEWHWWFIMRGKKRGRRLIDAGAPLTSVTLLQLNRRLTGHGCKAMEAQRQYEVLAGVCAAVNAS